MDQYEIEFIEAWSYELYNILRQPEGTRIARKSMTEDQYYEALRVLSKINLKHKQKNEKLSREKTDG